MKDSTNPTSTFAMVIGIFLLVEGVWGLFSDVVFGFLTTNLLHAAIHIALGLIGISLGKNDKARGYCIFLGALLLAVGILRFIPGINNILIDLLNVNVAVALVNILVGIMALGCVYLGNHSLLRA